MAKPKRMTVAEICGERQMKKKQSMKYVSKVQRGNIESLVIRDDISNRSPSRNTTTRLEGHQPMTDSRVAFESAYHGSSAASADPLNSFFAAQDFLEQITDTSVGQEEAPRTVESQKSLTVTQRSKTKQTRLSLVDDVEVGLPQASGTSPKKTPIAKRSQTSHWAWDAQIFDASTTEKPSGPNPELREDLRSGTAATLESALANFGESEDVVPNVADKARSTVFGRRRSSIKKAFPVNNARRRRSIDRASIESDGQGLSGKGRRRSLLTERRSRMEITVGSYVRDTTLRYETREYEVLRKTFEKHQDADHQLLSEAIPAILRELRYRDVREDWIRELCQRRVGESSFIELEHFVEVVNEYQRMHLEELYQDFKFSQQNSRGILTVEDTAILLERQGFAVVPCVLRELLYEVKQSGDEEIDGVRSDDYVHLREIFQYRGGFTNNEVEEAKSLFKRYDQNNNGRMDMEELCSALRWLGLPLQEGAADNGPMEHLVKLTESLHLAGDEGLIYEDFLQVLRRHREQETRLARSLYERQLQASGMVVNFEGAVNVMRELGYRTTSRAVVEEAAEQIGVDPDVESISFDNFYMTMRQVRKNEGFLEAELMEFEEAFHAHDMDGSGAVDVCELGGALRWLGYPVTVEEQQDLMDDADIDKSGEVDFDEFLKIMRWYKELELEQVMTAVATFDKDHNGTLDMSELQCLLVGLGYYKLSPGQEDLIERMTDMQGSIEAGGVPTLITKLSKFSREEFRKTHGYQGSELERLRREFKRADVDQSGGIAREEIQTLFKRCWVGPWDRKAASQVIASVDKDGDASLDFLEFLHLMRLLQDRADFAQVLKEQKTAAAGGWYHSEVRDLRKIFKIADSDMSKKLNSDELNNMLGKIMPLTATLTRKISHIIAELGLDIKKGMDFCEFLRLMRRVQDEHLLEESRVEGYS